MDRFWILVGMMASGKSTVGRELARLSQRRFLDTDTLIQTRFGRSVTSIFQVYGEDAFRDHESSVLRELQPEAAVLATGGGIVLRPQNWTELRRLGHIVFLDVEERILYDRLAHSKRKRPLLAHDDWEQRLRALIEARRPLYEQADLVFPLGTENAEVAASRLLSRLVALDGDGTPP